MNSNRVFLYLINSLVKSFQKYLLLLCVLFSTAVQSEVDFDLVLSGFGSLAYTRGSSDIARFARDNALKGAGRSGTLIVDSRAGIQLDSYFSNRLSATVQTLASQDNEGNFKPHIEWAFLNSQVTDNLSMRIGRISNPLFMNSQVRDVGYAYMKIRLSEVIYTTSPLSNFYGLDITRYFSFENSDVTTQFYTGTSKMQVSGSLVIDAKKMFGLFVNQELNNLRWRVAYTHLGVTADSDEMRDSLEIFTNLAGQFPEVQPTVDQLSMGEKPVRVYNLGIEADRFPWYFVVEWQTLDGGELYSTLIAGMQQSVTGLADCHPI